jgi:hypothetical protein
MISAIIIALSAGILLGGAMQKSEESKKHCPQTSSTTQEVNPLVSK